VYQLASTLLGYAKRMQKGMDAGESVENRKNNYLIVIFAANSFVSD
jgi:hypothetical protein